MNPHLVEWTIVLLALAPLPVVALFVLIEWHSLREWRRRNRPRRK